MGHVEDRAKERTTLTEADIAKARAYVKANRKQFKKDQTYSIVAPNRKGYYIVGDVGERRKKHVIKTVYGANMRPPGTIIQNAKLEHDLIKAADALFSLEKTASAVSYSVALMEYDKLASAYFGYELDEWLEYPEEMRKEAFVTLQRAGANLLQRGSKLLGGNQTLARGSANLRAKAAKGLERQSTLTSNVDKATRLQAEAAEQSSRAAQQARIGGNTELASRQAAHAERQVADAQANLANRTRAAREQGEAAYRSNVSPNMSAPEMPRNIKFDTIKPAPQQRPINMTPRQQQTVVNYNTNVRKAGTDAVEGLGRSNQGYAQARNSVRKAESAVANRAQPNTNVVSSKAPKAPAQPNANTGGGANTGSTPPPPAPPATDASAPINWKNVGYGALGTTALAGGGYGGYKMYQNKKQQQMGMPKMASWYSFVNKTASYSDALGMYKEALSRADQQLLAEYQAALKNVGVDYSNANLQTYLEKVKGYTPAEIEQVAPNLERKLLGDRARKGMAITKSVDPTKIKDLPTEELEKLQKRMAGANANIRAVGDLPDRMYLGGDEIYGDKDLKRATEFKRRVRNTLASTEEKLKNATDPEVIKKLEAKKARLERIANKKTKAGTLADRLTKARANKPEGFYEAGKAPADKVRMSYTDVDVDREGNKRLTKRQQGMDKTTKRQGYAGINRGDAAQKTRLIRQEVDARTPKAPAPVPEANIGQAVEEAKAVNSSPKPAPQAAPVQNANITAAVNEVKAQPTPQPTPTTAPQPTPQPTKPPPAPAPTPQPAPTPAPAPQPTTGKAPLPNAANVNPQQAAEQTIKNTAVPPKPTPPPPAADIPKATTVADDAAKTVTTVADDAAKAAVPKAAPKGRLGMLLGGTALAGGALLGLNAMRRNNEQEKAAEVQYRGRTFPGYNKPMKSDRPNKKKMVLAKKGDKVKLVHYGHTGYKHNYSKGAKKNYLTRSAGIRNKSGELTMNDKFSANYWARRDLWPKGQKADGSDKKR